MESKSVPSYFWATENKQGRDGRGILEMDGHVFKVNLPNNLCVQELLKETSWMEINLANDPTFLQMVPGLWGDGSYVSFESVAHPGMYVCRKRDGSVHIMRGNMNDDNFRRSGSFKVSIVSR